MRLFLLLLLMLLTLGCATRSIKYSRAKILKKYSADYQIYVDHKAMDLETVFLDKDNIENILVDKRTRALKITQFKPVELMELKNLNLDSIPTEQKYWNKKKIDLIIIDGIPLNDSLKEKIKIDPNAIKSFHILSEEAMKKTNLCRVYDGSIIVIRTK